MLVWPLLGTDHGRIRILQAGTSPAYKGTGKKKQQMEVTTVSGDIKVGWVAVLFRMSCVFVGLCVYVR